MVSHPALSQPVPPKGGTTNDTRQNPTNRVSISAETRPPFEERILVAQVALGRAAISPGSLDGVMGAQTRAALRVFQQKQGLPATGVLDEATQARLVLDAPIYTNYLVTPEDLAALRPLGKTWLAKSQQDCLAFESIVELVAEKSHSNPKLVRRLNPHVDWDNVSAGTILRMVNTDYPPVEQKAAFVRISLAERKLQAYAANSNLLVHFPCSIAARVDKRPLGEELHIAAMAPNPNYTFDPAVFPESAEAQELGRKLILQPGPNNPVGTVWLSLDKAGYGIHGTPKPEEVGRTESHGCFRLANWNAEYLLKLVSIGTPVFVEP
jgi:lipoprotein-anchoring transpeptidase ErfK/SrfK